MTCADVAKNLQDFASGDLPAAQSGELDSHLALCPSCATDVKGYVRIIRLARQLSPPALPPALLRRLLRTARGRAPRAGPPAEHRDTSG
jgi:anti-sigma factor RsiW